MERKDVFLSTKTKTGGKSSGLPIWAIYAAAKARACQTDTDTRSHMVITRHSAR